MTNKPKKKSYKGLKIFGGTLGVFLILGLIAGGIGLPAWNFNEGQWFGLFFKENPTIVPDVYNGEDAWSNVKVKLVIKDFYTYNHPAIGGLSCTFYEDTATPLDGGVNEEYLTNPPAIGNIGSQIDSDTSDANGEVETVVQDFDTGKYFWLVVGDITSTNKSQVFHCVVQGENGNTKPSSIYCGVVQYKEVTEESELAIAWYDETFASLSEINFTSTYTDKIVDGYLKLTMSTSGECVGREMWDVTYGYVKLYVAFIFTESTNTASNAINPLGTQDYLQSGSPTGKMIFVCLLENIAYEVDSASNEVEPNTAVHWFKWKFDFVGCGISGTNSTQFTLGCTIGAHYSLTQFANGGVAYSTSAFSDTASTINCVS